MACFGAGIGIGCVFQHSEKILTVYTQIYITIRQVLHAGGFLTKLTRSLHIMKMRYENTFFREEERLKEGENVKYQIKN